MGAPEAASEVAEVVGLFADVLDSVGPVVDVLLAPVVVVVGVEQVVDVARLLDVEELVAVG